MGGIKRKMKRNKAERAKKEMKQQLMMFEQLGDECAACLKPFDKKSKEHAMTWKVVVREKEELVRLYCPDCWDKANKIIEEFNNDFRDAQETGRKVPDES